MLTIIIVNEVIFFWKFESNQHSLALPCRYELKNLGQIHIFVAPLFKSDTHVILTNYYNLFQADATYCLALVQVAQPKHIQYIVVRLKIQTRVVANVQLHS